MAENLLIGLLIVFIIIIMVIMNYKCSNRLIMRRLLSDHVYFTREYILAYFYDLKTDDVWVRLINNQVSIGQLIPQSAVGLFTACINKMKEIMIAIKNNSDQSEIDKLKISWYNTGRSLADELKIDQSFLITHLDNTSSEILGVVANTNTLPVFDAIHDNILLIADKIAN